MAKKKNASSATIHQGAPLAVEEALPLPLYGCVSPKEEYFAVLKFLGGDNGFGLGSSTSLTYRGREVRGGGRFRMLFNGMTMWIDESDPAAVLTYVHNSSTAELTVECNDNFAIVTNFRSGDLGIHVPRAPGERRRVPLISRHEAEAAFGSLCPRLPSRRALPAP